jgi:hypothetical protein
MKVVRSYPEVNLYWLLNGKGTFPSKKEPTTPLSLSTTPGPQHTNEEKAIQKILVLYTDGSFETFEPAGTPSK